MTGALHLLRKDLRLLLRGRGLLAILIGYPLVVAALVTIALQSGERRPAIAFVNLDTGNRTVRVGDRRLSIADYEQRLAKDVDVKRLDPTAAAAALEDGRVSAVLTLPKGFISDLQSGIRSPEIGLQVSRRSPIEAQSISRRLEMRYPQSIPSHHLPSSTHIHAWQIAPYLHRHHRAGEHLHNSNVTFLF